FEITETAAIRNLRQVKRLIEELIAIDCRFALDDFGTGVASYSYLKDLPVSFLKIDGEFTKDVLSKPFDRAMIESIQQIAHIMGIATVAEAVSSRAIAERLTEMGVDYLQGYWLDRPQPLAELLDDESEE
ncbi:MAG TPA: EAL domain-containing protein, partial [Thermoanaerobaculia bacterium]|nr:EAL domain-containing protein [Thermoanaerobaculia bacterium]